MPQVSLAAFVAGVCSGQHLGSFPTDTVPALAAHPNGAHLIYQAKQRSATKPLILMGATLDDLLPYVEGNDFELAVWRRVTDQFWPGPLTLVLPASALAPAAMNPEQTGTLGIRVPNQPLARYLLTQTGPLATTSANRSGEPPLTRVDAIAAQFPEVLVLSAEAQQQIALELGLDLEAAPTVGSGLPSTVACWRAGQWEVLRQGAVQLSPTTGQPPA